MAIEIGHCLVVAAAQMRFVGEEAAGERQLRQDVRHGGVGIGEAVDAGRTGDAGAISEAPEHAAGKRGHRQPQPAA